MERIMELNGRAISTSQIAEIGRNYSGNWTAFLKDGTQETCAPPDYNEYIGSRFIIQVVPSCNQFVAVYIDEGEEYEEDVFFFGLYADGLVRPLSIGPFGLEACEEVDNFKELRYKSENWRKVEADAV